MKVDLYNGDCLEVMDKLIGGGYEHKIDAIICDPPYGITACSWDSVIPFDEMWERLNKLIKDNGAIVLFGSEPFSSALRMSNIKNYKYDWIWDKTRGFNFQNAKKMPMKSHEIISIFYKKLPTYNPQMRKGFEPYSINEGFRKSTIKTLGQKEIKKEDRDINKITNKTRIASFYRTAKENNGERYPLSIISCKYDSDKYHPTQKPIKLMEYLIKTYTNEGETVLDFTMGSGSTGVACVSTNRNFIGIELDKGYFDIAKKRIDDANTSIFDL